MKLHWTLKGLATLTVLVLSAYFINPFGVPSLDPRGRVLGVIPYTLPTDSMAPTYPRGTWLVACTWAYVNAEPQFGDVVVFRHPYNPDAVIMKRVIGVAGDQLAWVDRRLKVNGVETPEPYLQQDAWPGASGEWQVPAGQLFMAGDDRGNSEDSRHYGPVPVDAVIGRVCYHGS